MEQRVYFLFFISKIDIKLERRLRKLHVSTGTAAVFTRIIFNWITQQLATLRESYHSYSHTLIVITIIYIPDLPRIRNKEHISISIPYSLFLI